MSATASLMLTGARATDVAIGQFSQATAANARGTYQKAQYDRNATIAATEATQAIAEGDVAAGQRRAAGREELGADRASYGAQGVSVDSGSAVDVQANTARFSALDAMTIRNNAARKAWGYNVEAQNDTEQGILAKLGGENTAEGLRSQAAGTLLTGASEMYSLYTDQRKKQPLSPGRMTGGRTQ